MASSYCPNCRQAVGPNDDICENCGAVLTPVAVAAPAPATSLPTSSGHATTCPNCSQAIKPGEDICEHCGAVVATLVAPAVAPAPVGGAAVAASSAQPVTICPHCRQQIKPGEDICEHCGAVIDTVLTATQPASVSASAASGSAPRVSSAVACPRCGNPRPGHVKFCNRCGYRYQDASIVLPDGTVPTTRSSELVTGSILHGKYRISGAIGAGGMGSVYLAEDMVLKRKVVIKTLLNEDDVELAAQSIKEREFLATIKHANIVSIYDFITIGTRGYIVMEYVQGKTLEQIMEERNRPFDVPSAIRYILGILPAFTYLAKLNFVYCDFKPQNVIVERLKDDSEVVKLIDLGTVIHYEPNPKDVYGTPGFYAREAVKHPSPQTDLYSICRTLAYMVSLMDLSNPVFGMPAPSEYQVFQEYPALYRLLYKGTHPTPERRFQSAAELADQLRGVLRMVEGGQRGVPVTSSLFVSGALTTSGKLGQRGLAVLDERDKAIDALRHGDLALRSGGYNNAIAFYKQAQAISPNSIDAHLRLAEVYIDTGEYSLALAEITQVQRLAPGHWKIAWYTGRLLEAQENYTEAAKQYQALIDELPGELPPMQALARVYAKQQRPLAAVDLYAAVLKADPGNTDASLGMADELIKLQRLDEAAKVLASIDESSAKYVDAQLLLCDLYLNHIQPLTSANVRNAVQTLEGLVNRTEDARFFLMRAQTYRAAWQLAREKQFSSNITLPGVSVVNTRTLGQLAEQNYQQYLRRVPSPPDRETIIRQKMEVAPWRVW